MAGVKMTDIAKEAGVSIATVGRVLHRKGYVSEEARIRVEAAIQKLGYVPNAMARALKSQKSGIIGSLVVYNQNNLYQKINNSVIAAAENHGYQIITIQGRMEHRDEEEIVNQFIGMRVDGLVITSNSFLTNELFDRLHALSIPVVTVERTYRHPFVDNIVVRDQEGTYGAARRFLELGHHRVALIASNGSELVERRRLAGFRQAMAEAGVPEEQQIVQLTDGYSVAGGRAAMETLLARNEPPTGVVCTADTLAAGAMQAIHRAGKRVPEDISISGYDNVLAAQLAPPIDSVDLDLARIGELLFSLLERRMENAELPPRTEYLDTVYVSRGTIRNLNQVFPAAGLSKKKM